MKDTDVDLLVCYTTQLADIFIALLRQNIQKII